MSRTRSIAVLHGSHVVVWVLAGPRTRRFARKAARRHAPDVRLRRGRRVDELTFIFPLKG